MKKLVFLSLLLAGSLVSAQSATQGQFTWTVAGFAPIKESSTTSCQPGPGTSFPACALPAPSLGQTYTQILQTVGMAAPLICTVSSGSLPTGWTLTANGTTCVISGTVQTTGTQAAFTVSVTGG